MEENSIDYLSMILDEELIPFAIGAAIVAGLIIFVDVISGSFRSKTNKGSVLGITYTTKNWFPILLIWVAGGFIVSYLVAMFGLIDTTKQAMISAGIGWPVLFSKLVDKVNNANDDDDDDKEKIPLDEDLGEE